MVGTALSELDRAQSLSDVVRHSESDVEGARILKPPSAIEENSLFILADLLDFSKLHLLGNVVQQSYTSPKRHTILTQKFPKVHPSAKIPD